ncbi:unnamed protein product, partial [Symbiodinium pilosum]
DGDWTVVASGYHGSGMLRRPPESSRWVGVPWPWPSRPPDSVSQLRHSANEATRRTFTWRARNRL